MKNIFIGIIGLFLTTYVVLAGLNIYRIQTQRIELEETTSRAVLHVLKEYYLSDDVDGVYQDLSKELCDANVVIEDIDLEKGILHVKVTKDIDLLTGGIKQLAFEKVAIMERIDTTSKKVKVTFYVDGEIYKEYHLTKGEQCPMPKVPEAGFVGWAEYGAQSIEPVEVIGEVWEDKVYLAITE